MSERSTITRHALTVLAGQLAVMAFGVTDTIVAGRHAEASLAALSIGSAIFVSVYVALMGLLQALLPVWAEQRGAQNSARIGASVRQALYVCAIAALLGKFVLAPLIMVALIAAGHSILPLPSLEAKTLIVQSSVSALAVLPILANEAKGDVRFATNVVTTSTILFMIVVPLVDTLLQMF